MKIGIIGPGSIANTVAPAFVNTECIECYAVASRDRAKAEAFAQKFGFQKVYDSYEQMLCAPELELVYIATPHSYHYEHMMLCIEHGKAVVCEKAFTLNADQAKKVMEAAQAKGVYVAEAIWTRYMPSRKMIQDTIDSGIIGKVNTLTANLSYDIDGKERIVKPELAGGALLDIGVYGLNFATMHFGTDIERIESSVLMTDAGIDAMESITIFYKDGRMAVLTHSIYCRGDRKGIIHGENGYIVVENINNPSSISVFDSNDQLLSFQEVPPQINGYEYEFIEAAEQISKGETQSYSMPLADSVYVMELMDGLRSDWGMVYPQEK